MSMKLLFLIVCLVHSHGSYCTTAEGKRYEYQSMVDPLTRRSPLDKNFMRFGRSSTPPDDDAEEALSVDNKPQDDLHRLSRSKDNFIRFGRSDKNDKDLDNFLRSERARQDNFMRFGRGRDVQNFIRFGRGRENFMRFGRGRNENFMRFGRGKQDNFIRFGKNFEFDTEDLDKKSKQTNFLERSDEDNSEENTIDRSGRAKTNFLRFGRGKQDSGFIRFGRNEDNLARSSRPFQDKNNDGFIRFGRSGKGKDQAQRTKRSVELSKNEDPLYLYKEFSNDYYDPDSNYQILPYDLDEEYDGTSGHQEVWSRKKRSTDATIPPFDPISNIFPEQLNLESYYPSPLSAGLPNFIVGPEFSLLPPLDISPNIKKTKFGDRNFIRLG